MLVNCKKCGNKVFVRVNSEVICDECNKFENGIIPEEKEVKKIKKPKKEIDGY